MRHVVIISNANPKSDGRARLTVVDENPSVAMYVANASMAAADIGAALGVISDFV